MVNPKNIAKLLVCCFKDYEESAITPKERELVIDLEELIEDIIIKTNNGEAWNSTEISVDYDSSDDEEDHLEDSRHTFVNVEYKKRAVEYWLNNGKRRKVESVQNSFKKVKRLEIYSLPVRSIQGDLF